MILRERVRGRARDGERERWRESEGEKWNEKERERGKERRRKRGRVSGGELVSCVSELSCHLFSTQECVVLGWAKGA